MPTVARELMPDLDVRRLARSVHEAAARLRDDREDPEPFDRFLLERQVWWGRLFLDPDSQYEIVALTRAESSTARRSRSAIRSAQAAFRACASAKFRSTPTRRSSPKRSRPDTTS